MQKVNVKYIVLIVVTLFAGSLTLAAAPEIPIPPMPASKKKAIGTHKLISPESVKKFVPGLTGNFNAETGVAFINGRVHTSCVPMLSLVASPRITVENSVPFALMASDDGLKCLERTHLECNTAGSCVSLQSLSRDPKTADRFEARVDTKEKPTEKVKVTLSKKALVLNDRSVRLEATADCCNLAHDPGLGDESPMPAKDVKDLKQVTNALMNKVRAESVETSETPETQSPAAIPMPPPSTKAAETRSRRGKGDDADDEDAEKDAESGEKRRPLAPGMQRVATDEEIEQTVQKNMLPLWKQYYEGLLQAQQFQFQSQMQMMQFQMNMAQQNKQTTTNATSFGNLMQYNWANLSGAGTGYGGVGTGLGMGIGTVPTLPTFTLPTLGGDRGR